VSAYRSYALIPATHVEPFTAYAVQYRWERVATVATTEVARLQHPMFKEPLVIERSTEHKKHYIVHGSGLKTLRGYKTIHGVS
jgi:hypothetical protein